ncbi:MAG: DUF2335 domain-containing protein [Parcubacteria group bacterium]
MAKEIERRDSNPHRMGSVSKDENSTRVAYYSAPLPPSSEFARYEEVLPGSADRILGMSEAQSKHRRFIEKVVVIFDALKGMAGLISALVIVLAGMGAGVYLILENKPIGGFVTLLTPLAIVATAFIFERKQKKTDE